MAEETNVPKIIHMVFHDGSGDPDDDPDHERSENEIYYDDVIAPKLAEIANLCGERGMSIVCDVEYSPDEIGSTILVQEGAGVKILFTRFASKSRANVDKFIMGMYNFMEDRGELGVSIYMKLIQNWKDGKGGMVT